MTIIETAVLINALSNLVTATVRVVKAVRKRFKRF